MLGLMLRRKVQSFIINPHFQWRFIRMTFILAAFVYLTIYASVQALFWKFQDEGVKMNLKPGSAYFQLIDRHHSVTNFVFVVVGGISAFAILLGGIFVSHRVAGPLYRLRRHLDDVADGKTLKNISFRKNDYFTELVGSYNRQLEYLVKHSSELQNRKNGDSTKKSA